MRNRNPYSVRTRRGIYSVSRPPTEIEEVGSSSSSSIQQSEIGPSSSSNQQSEIGPSSSNLSSSSLDVNFDSSRSNLPMDIATSIAAKFDENTIYDPDTKATYYLEKEIGSFYYGRCHVYRARYSEFDQDKDLYVPSGVVTLKTIDMNLHKNEFNELRRQGTIAIAYIPYANVIGSMRSFGALDLFCVSLPYMSEGSLRYVLSTRSNKNLPEDLICVVLKQVLVGLRDELHVDPNPRFHKTLNAGDIFVHIDDATGEMLIKLAFQASVYHSGNTPKYNRAAAISSSSFLDPKNISKWGVAPEVLGSKDDDNIGPKSDIWLLGITALELAYGNLPVRNRGELNYIIKKIREKKKFPKSLEKLLIKRRRKLKKVMNLVKRKKRVFSEEFEEMVLSCLSENPENRPTAHQLLNTPFFTPAFEKFKQFVLKGKNPEPTDS